MRQEQEELVIEQVEVKVDVIAMAMPVPTAHTMMPKRRLDEVRTRTMLIAQNTPCIVAILNKPNS